MSYVPPPSATGHMYPSASPYHQQQQQPVPPGHATVTYYPPAGQPQQQSQQLVIQQAPVGAPFRVQSYMGHVVFSCFAIFCCGGFFGLIAFILALVAQGRSTSSPKSARSLGNASVAMSITAIITFVLFILHFAIISPVFL